MRPATLASQTLSRLDAVRGSGPTVWGVLNVTPDSFSDGGRYLAHEAAVAQGTALLNQGAHVIDVGGESTRPGATPVPRDEELARVLPVVRALAEAGAIVSIDTIHAETARQAVAVGAAIINDVSGGLADPLMYDVARETGAVLVLGHWRGIPDVNHAHSQYTDVVAEVREALAELSRQAVDSGVSPAQLVLDPGLGFDKTGAQGWEILSHMSALQQLGYPVLIGVSRKRMLTEVLDTVPGAARETSAAGADHRDLVTAVASAQVAERGAWGVRVHDVAATVQALAVGAALQSETAVMRPAHEGARSRPGSSVTPTTNASFGSLDRITLTGLEVFAHHGVFDFEREQGQIFLIDAELSLSVHRAASTDELARTVHYGELAEAIVAAVSANPVDLIETVAERVAEVALSFAGVHSATITVHKPDAPIAATFRDVSVSVTRFSGAQ